MKKESKTLTSDVRKEIIDKLLDKLILFANKLQSEAFLNMDCVTRLKEFKNKEKLNHEIINLHQSKIAEYFAICFPQIKDQLLDYWNAWSKVFSSKMPESIDIRKHVDEFLEHMDEIDSMYKEALAQKPETNNVALYAIFYTHMLKREKIEYALIKDLEEHLSSIPDFDIEKTFSVGEKMPKSTAKTGYVTHGTAIRDAFAHKKYKIENKNNKKYIILANNEYGYDFKEIFTLDEFIHYVKSTDMLYRIMFMMQDLIILCVLLHESLNLDR